MVYRNLCNLCDLIFADLKSQECEEVYWNFHSLFLKNNIRNVLFSEILLKSECGYCLGRVRVKVTWKYSRTFMTLKNLCQLTRQCSFKILSVIKHATLK